MFCCSLWNLFVVRFTFNWYRTKRISSRTRVHPLLVRIWIQIDTEVPTQIQIASLHYLPPLNVYISPGLFFWYDCAFVIFSFTIYHQWENHSLRHTRGFHSTKLLTNLSCWEFELLETHETKDSTRIQRLILSRKRWLVTQESLASQCSAANTFSPNKSRPVLRTTDKWWGHSHLHHMADSLIQSSINKYILILAS